MIVIAIHVCVRLVTNIKSIRNTLSSIFQRKVASPRCCQLGNMHQVSEKDGSSEKLNKGASSKEVGKLCLPIRGGS